MAQHVKILGILHIVFSSFLILGGLIAFVVMGGVAGMVAATEHSADAEVAVPLLGGIGLFVFILLLVLSIPGMAGGIGLINYKPWARILVIILSALELLNIPFGTALGIYGFWVLLNPQTEALFHSHAPAPVRP
jgi:hypothetical protein